MQGELVLIEIEGRHAYSLRELCESACVAAELVVEMVEQGILAPEGGAPANWSFACSQLLRLKRAVRLRRDLELDLAGIALALDLLDHVDALQRQVRTLEQHLSRLVRP